MTTLMLNEFVEKIIVHERDRKGSADTTQKIEIYFNFITPFSLSSALICSFWLSICAFFLPLVRSSYSFCFPLALNNYRVSCTVIERNRYSMKMTANLPHVFWNWLRDTAMQKKWRRHLINYPLIFVRTVFQITVWRTARNMFSAFALWQTLYHALQPVWGRAGTTTGWVGRL